MPVPMRLLFALLSCAVIPLAAHSACDDIRLPRAGFADAIVDREPVGDGSAAAGRLWFFSEVRGAAGVTLQHQWQRNGAPDVMVELPVAGNRWRTWSARHGDNDDQWSVRVTTDSGCDLGEYAMLGERDTLLLLTRARQQLRDNDPGAARSSVRQAQQQGNDSPRLQQFLQQELALAELARDIERDDLYTASGRIDALQQLPLDSAAKQQLDDLQQRWQQRRETLHQQMQKRIANLQALLDEQPVACETDIATLLPQQERQALMITEQRHDNTRKSVALLDRRTGLPLSLTYACLKMLPES